MFVATITLREPRSAGSNTPNGMRPFPLQSQPILTRTLPFSFSSQEFRNGSGDVHELELDADCARSEPHLVRRRPQAER